MATNAIAGAALGLIAGLVFGFIIRFIGDFISLFPDVEGPQDIAPFLGMSFGTLTGAFLGGLAGLKK